MEKKNRRQFSPQDKVRILRLHLLEGKAISEICEAATIRKTRIKEPGDRDCWG